MLETMLETRLEIKDTVSRYNDVAAKIKMLVKMTTTAVTANAAKILFSNSLRLVVI